MATSVTINREPPASTSTNLENQYEIVRRLVSGNAVVVFSMSGCCMCTVAKRLLFGLGVGPTVVEVDQHSAGADIQAVLFQLVSEGQQPVPAVFVGGKFLGGVETLMAFHINGTLVPLLKDAVHWTVWVARSVDYGGKLQVLGLDTALKILFSDNDREHLVQREPKPSCY